MTDNEQEKEVFEGYEIKSSVRIGSKRLVMGIHEDKHHEKPYFVGDVKQDEIFVRYSGYVYKDYFEAVRTYIGNMENELKALENKRAEIGMDDVSCLSPDDLISISWDEDLTGKIVAIDDKYLFDGCKDISRQLFYLDGGFGTQGGGRGRACYGWDVYTRQRDCIRRPQIIGIVPDDKLPEFAKKTLEMIQSGELSLEKEMAKCVKVSKKNELEKEER